jgi:tRNA nucleotidyltransferase (CCA-adding enzyme)
MREDRLRALRAMRFAARLDFTLDASTWDAIVDSAPYLTRLSPERVKQELDKTMEQVRSPSSAFMRWRESGAFAALVPALAAVSDDVLRAVDALPMPGPVTRPLRRSLRFATLLSGCEPKAVEQTLRALRASNQEITVISSLVERWTRHGPTLGKTLSAGALPTAPELRRLAASVGRLRVSAFVRLAAARWHTGGSGIAPRLVRRLYRDVLATAFRDPLEVADLAVDGDDLRRAGTAAGPALGRLLHELVEWVIEDPSRNTRESLLSFAAAMASAPDQVRSGVDPA